MVVTVLHSAGQGRYDSSHGWSGPSHLVKVFYAAKQLHVYKKGNHRKVYCWKAVVAACGSHSKLYEVFETDNSIYLIMDLMQDGSLSELF